MERKRVKPIDRADAHKRLDAFLDAHEAAIGCNDPVRHAAARQAAYQTYLEVRRLGRELIDERLGAARIARAPFEPASAWGSEAEEAARHSVAPLAQASQEDVMGQRRMIARYLLDHADDLPPNLAMNFIMTMHQLNIGGETPFSARLRVKGLRAGAGKKAPAELFIALWVYYLAGYRACRLDDVLHNQSLSLRDLSLNALNKIVARLGIRKIVMQARAAGDADRKAGKPEKPEYAGVYDLEQLTRLRGM
jgi:hypothetical protein